MTEEMDLFFRARGCSSIIECVNEEFNNNTRWKSECNRLKKEKPNLAATEIYRIVFANCIDHITKCIDEHYRELYEELYDTMDHEKRQVKVLNKLCKLKLQNSFRVLASESGEVIKVEIDDPTPKEVMQIVNSVVAEIFGKEGEEFEKKYLKKFGFEEDNYLERVDSKEMERNQLKEVIVQQHIHIGDKIGTLVKDSVVQRSNIGASARKCPNCGREVEANEKFCLECGARL